MQKGTVERIEGGTSRKDGSKYENWFIGGEKFSTKKFAGQVKEGDEIEFDFMVHGEYKNISQLKVLGSHPEVAEKNVDTNTRNSSLLRAMEYHNLPSVSANQTNAPTEVDVINSAQIFYNYLTGAKDEPESVPF